MEHEFARLWTAVLFNAAKSGTAAMVRALLEHGPQGLSEEAVPACGRWNRRAQAPEGEEGEEGDEGDEGGGLEGSLLEQVPFFALGLRAGRRPASQAACVRAASGGKQASHAATTPRPPVPAARACTPRCRHRPHAAAQVPAWRSALAYALIPRDLHSDYANMQRIITCPLLCALEEARISIAKEAGFQEEEEGPTSWGSEAEGEQAARGESDDSDGGAADRPDAGGSGEGGQPACGGVATEGGEEVSASDDDEEASAAEEEEEAASAAPSPAALCGPAAARAVQLVEALLEAGYRHAEYCYPRILPSDPDDEEFQVGLHAWVQSSLVQSGLVRLAPLACTGQHPPLHAPPVQEDAARAARDPAFAPLRVFPRIYDLQGVNR